MTCRCLVLLLVLSSLVGCSGGNKFEHPEKTGAMTGQPIGMGINPAPAQSNTAPGQ